MVQVLLKHHADVHTRGLNDWTPLHYASSSRNLKPEITRLFLEHGADANSKGLAGITLLSLLLHCSENVEVAEILLEHGADPNIRSIYCSTSTTDRSRSLSTLYICYHNMVQKERHGNPMQTECIVTSTHWHFMRVGELEVQYLKEISYRKSKRCRLCHGS